MHVQLSDIGKRYGKHWIFRNITCEFAADGVYPIIGSNGSGKSTLLQVISGYVSPNEGQVIQREGAEIDVSKWYQHTAIVAPYLDLFEEFTVEESIEIHSKLKTMRVDDLDQILDSIELTPHRNKPLKALSSGMRQRLKLALGLYSDAQLLLLDEPCSNLDRKWISWFNETLKSERRGRITVICSNSQTDELNQATVEPIDVSDPRFRG